MSDFVPTPERQKQILSLLTRQQRLSVAEIVAQFAISEATARRDLESLASQGKAQRVHGGVIAVEQVPHRLFWIVCIRLWRIQKLIRSLFSR